MIGKLRAINGETQSTEISVTVDPEEKPVKVELKSDSSVAISGEPITLTATVTKGNTKLKDVPVSFKATGDFTWTHEVEGGYTTDENGTVVAKPKTTVEIGEPGGSATFTASVTIDGVEATSNVVNITVRDEIVTVTLTGNPTQVDSGVPTTLTAEVKKGGVGYGPIPVRFRSDGKRTWQFDELSYEADASGVAIAKPFTTVEAGDVGGDYTFTASVTVGGKTITSNEITVNVVGVPAEPSARALFLTVDNENLNELDYDSTIMFSAIPVDEFGKVVTTADVSADVTGDALESATVNREGVVTSTGQKFTAKLNLKEVSKGKVVPVKITVTSDEITTSLDLLVSKPRDPLADVQITIDTGVTDGPLQVGKKYAVTTKIVNKDSAAPYADVDTKLSIVCFDPGTTINSTLEDAVKPTDSNGVARAMVTIKESVPSGAKFRFATEFNGEIHYSDLFYSSTNEP